MELEADMIVLAVGLEPSEDTASIAEMMHVSRTKDGFFMEAHPKLNPLETPTAGIYAAGCAQGPKDIPDTVCQAKGCAGDVIRFLNIGKVKLEPTVVSINPELCKGCRLCEKLCPYTALEFDAETKIMRTESTKCRGCGTCAAACPAGAIKQGHFSSGQIFAELEGLLRD